jgi:hypothetical protein
MSKKLKKLYPIGEVKRGRNDVFLIVRSPALMRELKFSYRLDAQKALITPRRFNSRLA